MKSEDSARFGLSVPDALDQAAVLVARVLAVHRVENAVGARLHRQVQVGHHRRQIAVGCDQRVVHVARMAGGVAQARDAGHVRQAMQQAAERPDRAVRPLAVIGVDVLADQRELAHARIGEAQGLVEDLCDRARDLRAAGIGHDAEGAELVAALLDREEGRHAAALGLGLRRLRAGDRTCPRSGIPCRRRDRCATSSGAPAGGDSSAARPPRRRRAPGAGSPCPRPARRSRRRRPSSPGPGPARSCFSSRTRPSSE